MALSKNDKNAIILLEKKLNKSPLSNYGIDVVPPKPHDPPVKCQWCDNTESKKRFKVCLRCVQLGVKKNNPFLHYYCCKACQIAQWKLCHRMEHYVIESLHPQRPIDPRFFAKIAESGFFCDSE